MDLDIKANAERRNTRMEQLYNKPVTELVRMIIALEEENEKWKEYRSMVMRIRNIVTPKEERRRQGRPSKTEEVI